MYLSVDACRVQRRVPDTVELELQAATSFLLWVLGTKPRFCKTRKHLNL